MSRKASKDRLILLAVIFTSIFLSLAIFSSQEAFAHGQPPSACPNLYDAVITSMIIESDGIIYDPMITPVITAHVGVGYDVTLTLQTAPQSKTGNTENGTAWLRHTAFGYALGSCISDGGPNKIMTIKMTNIMWSGAKDGRIQLVEWGSSPVTWPSQVTYIVRWHDGTLSSSTINTINQTATSAINTVSDELAHLTVDSTDMNGIKFEGMWVELWRDGILIQEGYTPFSTYVQTETQYEVFMGNWENIIFDHWDDNSTNPRRAITPTQDISLIAFFRFE